MSKPQEEFVDDYYSAHTAPAQDGHKDHKSDDGAKKGLKLKIKAKPVAPESEAPVKAAPVMEAKIIERAQPKIVHQPKVVSHQAVRPAVQPKVEETPIKHVPQAPEFSVQKPKIRPQAPRAIFFGEHKPEVKKEEPKASVIEEPKHEGAKLISRTENVSAQPARRTEDAPEKKWVSQSNKAGTPSGGGHANNSNNNRGGFSRGGDKKRKESSDELDFAAKKYAVSKKGFKPHAHHDDEDDGSFRRAKKSNLAKKQEKNLDDVKQTLVDRTGQEVPIPAFLNVKEFSDKIGIPLTKIIGECMKNGLLVTLNTKIDFDTCFLLGETFGIKVIREQNNDVSIEGVLEGNLMKLLKDEDSSLLETRSPIVSIMGHVDHGKTSILDYIRKTEVAAGEAGGITQRIGAYQVERDGKKITFLDTPGHEAFSIMRARGAKLTDIAVIVIAGDEGMKPQTIESINHAKEAGVPIIIAVNKMDKPGINLDLVRTQMSEQGLQPEDWGGDVIMVPVSAHTGLGIETLLEMILLTAEMLELRANPNRAAIATVIESHLDTKQGPIATVLVNTGSLEKGDCFVCGAGFGRLRYLKDFRGKNIDKAGPSTPVLISGLSSVAEGGEILQVVSDPETARQKAQEFQILKESKSVNKFESASLEMLLNRIKTGNLKHLKVVLKSDSNGSLEAIKDALLKLSTPETQVQIIHAGVGDVNDSDVLMAGNSQAILVGYNVGTVGQARHMLTNSKIEFINKKVIYHILERVEALITGMIDIKHEDIDLGEAKVKAIFFTGKDRLVIGLGVTSGKIENRAKIRVVRESRKAGSGEVLSLKSGVMDVSEVNAGEECGIAFKGDVKIEIGDVLEFYKTVQRK